MAVLELTNISKHFGAIQAVNDVSLSLEPGEVVGLMGDNGAGKSTLVKMIAGNFRPSHGTMRMDGKELDPAQAGRGAPARHRDRPPGPGAVQQSDRGGQRLSRPRTAPRRRPVPHSRLCRDVQARRRDLRRTEVGDPAARSRQADVGRPAAGGGDRPHHAVASQDRADGRADGGDLGAPGRRGAEPDPASARPGHRGRADQPPHARRLRRRRPRHRHAARPQGRRQARSPRVRPRRSPASSPAPSSRSERHDAATKVDDGSHPRPDDRAEAAQLAVARCSPARPSGCWSPSSSPASSCRFATDAFATPKNLFNITRNVTFVAIIALGMTMVIITGGIDLSVGSVLCLCSHGAGRDHACRLQHRGRHRRLDRHGAAHRRLQRHADRLSRLSALRGDARHAVDRAQPGDGRVQQHRGLPVRPRPRQAAGARRRRLAVRHRQSGALHDRAGADHRLRAALDASSAGTSSPSAATSMRRR